MKKFTNILILVVGLMFLVSCDELETNDVDSIKPIIQINPDNLVERIKVNSSVDLLELAKKGVNVIDNKDSNEEMLNSLEINYSEVNLEVADSYKVYFNAKDKSGNEALEVTKTFIVFSESSVISPFPLYLDKIDNEALKPGPQRPFAGAWYHKVTSATDNWLGIEGTITLPEVKIRRYNNPFDQKLDIDPWVKNLDNPSIYMGGHASSESDVGLSLSLVQMINSNGDVEISKGSYAFRPFWRYITPTEKDLGGYDLPNGRRYAVSNAGSSNNMIGNWHFSDTQYYYLPGDKVRIIVYSTDKNYLQLQIEVIEKSSLASSVKIREENNWKDPENFVSPIFRSPGHGGIVKASYKRVNAIDQSGNEGKPIIHTNTEVNNAIWESVYLHRKINGVMYRVPFNESRSSSIGSPDETAFTYSKINDITGGSSVSIHPSTAISRPK